MATVISVENVSKAYRLGLIDARTLSNEIRVALARMRGKPNPLLKVDQEHLANREGEIIWALRDVSFKVEQGEVLGIIGRNGSGKSTLLKILSRITAPTSGTLRAKGRIASLLEVGTGFHPDLTGRENVYLNGAILGMNRDEVSRKFEEIVDFSGVETFIDTPVKRYSSGMYVRLAFSVAAHLEPEILILDEVLAVGDADFQKKCLKKMAEVAGEGRTVLFVSHNMTAVVQLCRNAVLLDNGTLIEMGQVDKVIQRYISNNTETQISINTSLSGNDQFSITDAYLLNTAGDRIQSPISGSEIRLVLEYESRDTLLNSTAMVTIYNFHNTPIAHLNSKASFGSATISAGKGKLICRIPKVPLPYTSYHVGAAITSGDRQVYHSSNILNFSVAASKFYPNSYMPPASYSLVLVENEWIFQGKNE